MSVPQSLGGGSVSVGAKWARLASRWSKYRCQVGDVGVGMGVAGDKWV